MNIKTGGDGQTESLVGDQKRGAGGGENAKIIKYFFKSDLPSAHSNFTRFRKDNTDSPTTGSGVFERAP